MCVCKGQVGLDEHLGEIAREHVQESWTTAKRSNLKARFRAEWYALGGVSFM